MVPKVLIIATSKYTRGGITAVIKAQQKGAQWRHFHCKWIGYHIDRANWIKGIYYLYAFVQYLLYLPFYQIVHFQFSLPTDAKRSYYFFRIAKLLKKKTIVHLHCGDQLPDIWCPIYDYMFTHCNLALVLSPSIKRMVESYVGKQCRIEVLYNPCPYVHTITPVSERKNEILFAGTLNQNKGYADLIKAFSLIAKHYPNWKLVFAGNGEVEEAKVLANTLDIINQCEFLGWIYDEQKEAVFRRASILCLASYKEGFPMAVLDAWAYGIPIVSSHAGGLVDIVKENENGLLFEAGNIKQIAEKLELLIGDVGLREHISMESRLLAMTLFNINNVNNQLGEFYNNLI